MGEAASVHSALLHNGGLSKERDYPYMCASGDPEKHLEEDSLDCASFPWGAQCAANSANPGWMFGGVMLVKGESSMMALIAEGQSLMVSFTIYGSFWQHKDGVYQTLSGGKSGGHSVTAMGYGNEDGTKYWLLQNSWGAAWGVDGYFKFLRGTNLAGIEKSAYWVRAWVSGGKQPECRDGPETGLTSKGVPIPCSEAGGLCKRKDGYGDTVRTNCQKSCNSCLTVGVDPPPAPTPLPTPVPDFWTAYYANNNPVCAELDSEADDGKFGYTRRRSHLRDNCVQKECKDKGLIWGEDQWKCEGGELCSGKCVQP